MLLYFLDVNVLGGESDFFIFGATKIPWFVYCLAACTAITYFLRDCNARMILLVAILVGCFVGYDTHISEYMLIVNTIAYFPYYWAGNMLKNKRNVLNKKKGIKTIGGMILVVSLICVFIFEDTGFCIQNVDKIAHLKVVYNSIVYVAYRIIYYVIVAAISFGVLCIVPSEKVCYTKVGTKTMQIYFWHIPIRSIIYASGLQELFYVSNFGVLMWLIISFCIMLILSLPIFAYPTNLIIKGFSFDSARTRA